MTQPLLEIRYEDSDTVPPIISLCPDYENSVWRTQQLAKDFIRRHLTSFALSYNAYSKINGDNAAEHLSNAANIIYNTDKYKNRGEFGELLLHGILKDFLNSLPIISKIYFKDGPNETVKGFDAVHFLRNEIGEIEILLGESKFYRDARKAVRDVTAEIIEHLEPKYLRSEFLAIINKLPEVETHDFEEIHRLLNQNTSLDKILSKITIPIFITYDSGTISKYTSTTNQFTEDFILEVSEHRQYLETQLENSGLLTRVRYVFLVLPVQSKEELVTSFHNILQVYKDI